MQRRTFLELGGAAAVAGFCAPGVWATEPALKIKKVTLKIGLPKPLKALHISDSHICLADERDNERKRTLAANRARCFPRGPRYLADAIAYAKAQGEILLHTGDLEDFVSAKNLDMIQSTFKGVNCVASVGNHEFSQYVGEAREDAAYKAVSFDRVKAVWPNDPLFASHVEGGVNFVAFDDVYTYTTAGQLALLKAEVAKGLPIILLCHVPYFAEGLYLAAMEHCGNGKDRNTYLIGVPKERWQHPKEGERKMWSAIANPETQAFIDYFESQPLIKAVFCGHLHWEWDGKLPGCGIPEYVAGLGAGGFAQEITIL